MPWSVSYTCVHHSCYLVRSFDHLSSPSVSESPSTKASNKLNPQPLYIAFYRPTNLQSGKQNTHRWERKSYETRNRRKIYRKLYVYIYIYIYMYICIYVRIYIPEPYTRISLRCSFHRDLKKKKKNVRVEARAKKLSSSEKQNKKKRFRRMVALLYPFFFSFCLKFLILLPPFLFF